MAKQFNCVTVGNPNAGKSTLFNALTGSNQQVGNWSGVTVEKKTGQFALQGADVFLTDLPGIYDLLPAGNSCDCSLDEQIAQQYLADQEIDGIINLVDATNIERHLYLTVQLRELGIPLVVVLNKIDAALERGINIDVAKMSQELGCPVVAVCSRDEKDIEKVKEQFVALLDGKVSEAALVLDYDAEIEAGVANLLAQDDSLSRGRALAMLGNGLGCGKCKNSQMATEVEQYSQALSSQGKDIEIMVATTRFDYVERVFTGSVVSDNRETFTDKLDKIVLHPVAGIPVFLFVMYLMFMFSINVGSSFIDFFDITAGALFVDHLGAFMTSLGSPAWLVTIIAGGVGQGIQTVATFIPVIAALFLALSVLEGSGYMARAAFVVDGLMRRIGLPGRAFVPMIVGFGCSVPAIMATRTLGSERERIVTGMMAPFMSCGARLPVYALFAAAFFPESGQNLVFLLYIIGIFAAIGTGLLLRSTLLPGSSSAVVMELPSYEKPKFKTVMARTGKRTKSFIMGAGKTIVIVVTLLNFVNAIGVDGTFGHEDSSESVLSVASQKVTPLFSPMGVEQDNWPATVGIITGIFAKEAVVGTLNSLYSDGAAGDEELAPFSETLTEALATIPENLFGIAPEDPLSISVGDVSSVDAASEELEVDTSTFGALQAGFAGVTAAFAYLLFVLLYTPCVAAMGALVNEFGGRWAAFAGLWTFGLAYGVATVFYQAATFAQHPLQSSLWIGFFAIALVVFYVWLKHKGKKAQTIIPGIKVITE
ncbi:Fe(2+) transporter permease subunit FeoB [Shewanella fidelis]|uniref:Ferrous iron transport protein B n=1 Tax=Shewanella fidelis TaxID=173509 RepID=A0AAW8NK37_9GAMM|nr:Fe(2+) transporter permease subunit FeoB [Shewanella fidelis]MDR8523222.1 Fe(2+) transporter permease subunit FeoB [Shewanella fidelis]MDW4811452.1 Fe(2+) transporter permease subunit FeoB [Shewanella fidelis]MDW4815573.1 Fe(2+) transporter permease subunit FeoB [Shewanella fidelis]MDW4819663.1 Fe(2+) transporter permease subunit FeoB [Shewanella fidelis]MDW4824363.1 Fe(2+) transporter permease subunit FeoB [Shewanella fidelis]